MNILSFDIEEWFIDSAYHPERGSNKFADYQRILEKIFQTLEETNNDATFFCVGGMAREFPEIVRAISDRGYEIGCHSDTHRWLNKMSQSEALEDTRKAIDSLEQCIGKKIVSYRAPAFSIGESNLWAFDVLAACGIQNDSSVFPAARDFGGFPGFPSDKPCKLHHNGIVLNEFPICMTTLLGKRMAFSGGGYFRFFPREYIHSQINDSDYSICYFHIADLLNETSHFMSRTSFEEYFNEPGTLKARISRFCKENVGRCTAFSKFNKLLRDNIFVSISKIMPQLSLENTIIL